MPHAENNPSSENKQWPATRLNVEELLLTWVLSGLRRLKLSVALLNGMEALRETEWEKAKLQEEVGQMQTLPKPMLTVGENARGWFIIGLDLRCHLKDRQTQLYRPPWKGDSSTMAAFR